MKFKGLRDESLRYEDLCTELFHRWSIHGAISKKCYQSPELSFLQLSYKMRQSVDGACQAELQIEPMSEVLKVTDRPVLQTAETCKLGIDEVDGEGCSIPAA